MVEELLLTGEIETADDDHLSIKILDEVAAEKFQRGTIYDEEYLTNEFNKFVHKNKTNVETGGVSEMDLVHRETSINIQDTSYGQNRIWVGHFQL